MPTNALLNSQGGQVVHRAMAQLPAESASHIKAVIIYGDPDKGQAMKNISPSIVTTICASSDPICKHIPLPVGSHLTYGVKHAKEGAADVATTLGGGASSGA
jgi:cutinase